MQGITPSADPHSSFGSLGQPVGVKSKNSCERHELIEFPPLQLLYPPQCTRLTAALTAAAPRASGRPLPGRRGKRSPSAGRGWRAMRIPQKAPSRIHFIARARPGSRSPHLGGTKRRTERAPESPRGCSSWFFSAQAPGDPKLSRNADPTLRKGTIPPRGRSTNPMGSGLREEAGTVRPSLPPASAHSGSGAWPAAPRDTPKMCPGVRARYSFVLFYRAANQASGGGQYFGEDVCSH